MILKLGNLEAYSSSKHSPVLWSSYQNIGFKCHLVVQNLNEGWTPMYFAFAALAGANCSYFFKYYGGAYSQVIIRKLRPIRFLSKN